MLQTKKLTACINSSLLNQVTLDEQEHLPVFGTNTTEVTAALYERAVRESNDSLISRMMYPSLVEFYARIGAYAATISTSGTLYEVGCGLAIPSLTYALLTHRPIRAIDQNRGEIKNAKKIAEKLNVHSIEFEVSNGTHVVEGKGPWYSLRDYTSQKPTNKDTLLVVNSVDDELDAALIQSNANNVIFVGGPGKLFGKHETYTSLLSGIDLWKEWFHIQKIEEYLKLNQWKNILLSGEEDNFLMPNMALLHISR